MIVFEWYVIMCESKNMHQKDMWLKLWITCSKYVNRCGIVSRHGWGDLYDHLNEQESSHLHFNNKQDIHINSKNYGSYGKCLVSSEKNIQLIHATLSFTPSSCQKIHNLFHGLAFFLSLSKCTLPQLFVGGIIPHITICFFLQYNYEGVFDLSNHPKLLSRQSSHLRDKCCFHTVS